MRDQISDWGNLADSRLANRGARIAAIAIPLAAARAADTTTTTIGNVTITTDAGDYHVG